MNHRTGKRKLRYFPWRFLLLTSLIVPLGGGPDKKTLRQQNYYFTPAQASELMRQFVEAVRPDHPENALLPPYIRERMDWINRASATGTVQANLWEKCEKCSTDGLMGVDFRNGRFHLDIYAPRLLRLAWDEERRELRKKLVKHATNTFLVALVHETIHMERGPGYFLSSPSQEDRFQEEVRTWATTVFNAIRPLRAQVQPLDQDWVKADDILTKCGDNPACLDFQEFVKTKCGFLLHTLELP